jgi:hypothetical protein
MTDDSTTPQNQYQEVEPPLKLPNGYQPTTTEMIIRGAGIQAETKEKPLEK